MVPQDATIVGEGANGIVQIVKDGDNVSVVKRLRNHDDMDALECFLAEINLLEQLSHRSIVSTRPKSTATSAAVTRPELFMEFLAGGDLKTALGRQMQCPGSRMYSFVDALRWSTQLASALAYLHGRSPMVIFRDLSAANVLLTSTCSRGADVKLVDFGLAKLLPSQSECIHQGKGTLGFPQAKKADGNLAVRMHASSQRVMMTGETGAYTYMSPEVVQYSHYSEKVDIFSLGCLMYELFSRQLCAAVLHARNCGDATALKRHALQVATGYRLPMPRSFPEPLARLISACWAQDAAERPSAADVHSQLILMQETGALEVMDARRKSFSCFG